LKAEAARYEIHEFGPAGVARAGAAMLKYMLFFIAILLAIVFLVTLILGIPLPQVFEPSSGSSW
jgi:hypothetical protein